MTMEPDAGGMPEVLTVEEAAALLRIGRSCAYALARQWRATGGRTGLPVVELGRYLRVPRAGLRRLLDADLARGDGTEDPTDPGYALKE